MLLIFLFLCVCFGMSLHSYPSLTSCFFNFVTILLPLSHYWILVTLLSSRAIYKMQIWICFKKKCLSPLNPYLDEQPVLQGNQILWILSTINRSHNLGQSKYVGTTPKSTVGHFVVLTAKHIHTPKSIYTHIPEKC